MERCLMTFGKSFQSLYAITEKDLSPEEAVSVLGVDNKFELLDCSKR